MGLRGGLGSGAELSLLDPQTGASKPLKPEALAGAVTCHLEAAERICVA